MSFKQINKELIVKSYDSFREEIKFGDLLAFQGTSVFSQAIKSYTNSDISHVGMVVISELVGRNEWTTQESESIVFVLESASLNGFSGVSMNRLKSRVDNYEGEIYVIPLKDQLDLTSELSRFIHEQINKPYDMKQAVNSALDKLDDIIGLTLNSEDFDALFCSELIAAIYEKAGLFKDIGIDDVNCSEITPIDLIVDYPGLYEDNMYQLVSGGKQNENNTARSD